MSKLNNVVIQARNDGYAAGFLACRKLALDYLNLEYLNPSVKRKSPEGEAILNCARGLSEHLRTTTPPTKDDSIEQR